MTATIIRYDMALNKFHTMMGYCIAAWAGVDDALFRIFRHCTSATEKQAAILYYRINGIDARLSTVDELVKSVLPAKPKESGAHDHPDVKRWKDLHTAGKDLLPIRRRIAHQPVRVAEGKVTRAPVNPKTYLYTTMVVFEVEASYELYASEMEKLRTKEADSSRSKFPIWKSIPRRRSISRRR